MKVKNLNELFTEFKKIRETKKDVAKEDNFYDYVSITTSGDLVDEWPGYIDRLVSKPANKQKKVKKMKN